MTFGRLKTGLHAIERKYRGDNDSPGHVRQASKSLTCKKLIRDSEPQTFPNHPVVFERIHDSHLQKAALKTRGATAQAT